MSPRLGIVAQAIGVVAFGSLVYFAFLSPEDPDPLTGIEIEDGVRINPPKFTTGARRQGGPDKRKAGRRRPRRSATLPRLVPTPSPSVEPVVTEPIDTPSGSQYADGVARIVGRVASARP